MGALHTHWEVYIVEADGEPFFRNIVIDSKWIQVPSSQGPLRYSQCLAGSLSSAIICFSAAARAGCGWTVTLA
jgi:hypothetical protein